MDSARHDRLSELFAQAVELPTEERIAFLTDTCGADTALLAEVVDLLDRDEKPAAVDQPIVDQSIPKALFEDAEHAAQLPKEIGPYEILDVLGRGGMGTVYRARQRQPARTIALKVVHAPLMSRALSRRIEYEAQVLARLQHEGIAQVFEAGAASVNGGVVPFFAMELVDGLPLTEHASQNRLTTRDRIRLMIRVCVAVQHAHQQGVIHRDLKPANVLVTSAGQPKVLDFGIARVTDSDLKTTTLHTDAGQLIGTVAYMSPEQASGNSGAVDTRSDVYALGVLTFEMLTGRLPYDVNDKPIAEAARIIRDESPHRLSEFGSEYQGDLETILGKSLDKDKARRYDSAAQLAADFERFLANEPIVARPASLTYQLRKFAQRNRGLVGSALAAMILLIVGVAGTSYGLLRATRERDDAIRAREQLRVAKEATETEAAKVSAVNAFLGRMLSSANPMGDVQYGNRDITVLEMLDREIGSIGDAFANQPAVESAVRTTVGMIYDGLGRYEEAEEQMRMALEKHRESTGPNSDDAIRGERDLAGILVRLGKLDEAIPMFRSALEKQESSRGAEGIEYGLSAARLGWALNQRGQYEEGERWIRKSLPVLAAAKEPHADNHARAMNNLAQAVYRQGRLDEAEELYLEAQAALVALRGPDHASIGVIENNIASIRQKRGDLAGSAESYARAVEILRKALGPQHPVVATTVANLGITYHDMGEYEQSVAITREALTIYRETVGEEHADYLSTLNTLAFTLRKMGDFAESVETYKIVSDYYRIAEGERHHRTLIAEAHGAEAMAHLGDSEDAEETIRRCVEWLRIDRGQEDPYTQSAIRAAVNFYCGFEGIAACRKYRAMLDDKNERSARLFADTESVAKIDAP